LSHRFTSKNPSTPQGKKRRLKEKERKKETEVLHGCETSSLTLTEEHRLWMFENRVLRKIIGPKRDKVTRK
jgi:hypothetical protein